MDQDDSARDQRAQHQKTITDAIASMRGLAREIHAAAATLRARAEILLCVAQDLEKGPPTPRMN